MSLEDVLQAALQLPKPQQRVLADTLTAMLVPEQIPLSEAWRAEIKKRSDEYDAGQAKTFSWDEVKEYARSNNSETRSL